MEPERIGRYRGTSPGDGAPWNRSSDPFDRDEAGTGLRVCR